MPSRVTTLCQWQTRGVCASSASFVDLCFSSNLRPFSFPISDAPCHLRFMSQPEETKTMQKAYCSISTTPDPFSAFIRHSVEATDIGAPIIIYV
jgi:hypothetical protein